VPVADPHDDDRVAVHVPLTDAAIVTSTRLMRRWTRAGLDQHHLIDPATGRPARTPVVAVIARAEEAWWAEGVAKAALVAGTSCGRRLLEASGVDGWLVDEDRRWTGAGRAGVDPHGRPRWAG
jgi:FAD:protein FMN transferase